ncbi:MAG: PP2C family protein-serine/threonine phosphatase [Bacteroidales bacterium]|nr:PP2C family protein-serine/threonine phosphatase [Bacteroidales bacterium]
MATKASLKRLQFCNFKLSLLLNITQAINDNLSTKELLDFFEIILRKDLNIGKVLIYSYNEKWDCILASGFDRNKIRNVSVENDLLYYNQITSLTTTLNPALSYFDVIIPVYHHDMPIAFIIIGDIDEERDGISPTIKHLHFIQTLTNVIIVAIENKRFFKKSLHQEKINKELELASKMQTMLIPNSEELPHNEKLFVSAYYLPHFEVGGDYYDFIKLNRNEYGFCIADVSGKGISAALLMSNFQANVRALFTSKRSLASIIEKLNETVIRSANCEKFITFFVAKYHTKTRELQYVNAGHNPPVLYNGEKKETKLLTSGCVGLGMFDEIPELTEGYLLLSPNSKIITYTDGLVEMENNKKEQFGTKPIEDVIPSDRQMDEIIQDIIKQLNVYKGQNQFFDDISILGVDFK